MGVEPARRRVLLSRSAGALRPPRRPEAVAAVKVGALDVSIVVDAEGSFATVAEAFPALKSDEPWRLPINAVLVRAPEATILVDTGVGPEPRASCPVQVRG